MCLVQSAGNFSVDNSSKSVLMVIFN